MLGTVAQFKMETTSHITLLTIAMRLRNPVPKSVLLAALCCVFACRESDPTTQSVSNIFATTHALLTTSLTAHYRLNETTGTTASDASGYNNTATVTTPTPPPTAPWITTGRLNGAANLEVDPKNWTTG